MQRQHAPAGVGLKLQWIVMKIHVRCGMKALLLLGQVLSVPSRRRACRHRRVLSTALLAGLYIFPPSWTWNWESRATAGAQHIRRVVLTGTRVHTTGLGSIIDDQERSMQVPLQNFMSWSSPREPGKLSTPRVRVRHVRAALRDAPAQFGNSDTVSNGKYGAHSTISRVE